MQKKPVSPNIVEKTGVYYVNIFFLSVSSAATRPPVATASGIVAAASRVGRDRDAGAAAHRGVGVALAVEHRGAAAHRDTGLECRSAGTRDHECGACARWSLEGEGGAAHGEGIPCALRPAAGGVARLREAGTRLQAADGHECAARYVELLVVLGVGVDGHFW